VFAAQGGEVGIYIQGLARRKHAVLPGDAPFHEQLAAAFTDWAQSRGIADITHVGVSGPSRVVVTVYPPAGPLAFTVDETTVGFDTKTSVAGPGYHAAVVDLCDALARALGLQWLWSLPEGRSGDDTGYAADRDSAWLEREFVSQFVALVQSASERASGASSAINLPEDLVCAPEQGGVAAPLGPVDQEAWSALLHADADEQATAAREFYPWWEGSESSAFWTKTCLAMLWTEAVWRAPRNDWQKFVHGAIFSAADRARDLNAPSALPSRIDNAICELRQAIDNDVPASLGGVGYRRGLVAFHLFESWWIEAPGHLIVEAEGTDTVCLWFGGFALRATSFTVTKKDPGAPTSWPNDLADAEEREAGAFRRRVAWRARRTKADDAWFALAGCVRDEGGRVEKLLLSLTSDDESTHITKLHQLVGGVRFWPPQTPAHSEADA
jgi:hypothetical protein